MNGTTAPDRPGGKAQIVALVLSLALVVAIAAIGGAATGASIDGWYRTLAKPPFNPPDRVFGPAWALLYALMAVAAWRVWRRRHPHGRRALTVYALQLALNLAWTLIFFGLRLPGWALADILVLLAAVAATIALFWRVDRPAALLLVPYLAWVAFAAALNGAIWRLN